MPRLIVCAEVPLDYKSPFQANMQLELSLDYKSPFQANMQLGAEAELSLDYKSSFQANMQLGAEQSRALELEEKLLGSTHGSFEMKEDTSAMPRFECSVRQPTNS